MKTIAVRLDDDVMELLTVVSQLEETTIVEQIRQAVGSHLERKVQGGELASRAQAALDDIDREAEARKEAIGSLIGTLPKGAGASGGAGKGRSRRGQAPESHGRTIGFSGPQRGRTGTVAGQA